VVALKAVLLAVADRRMAWTVVSFSSFSSLCFFLLCFPLFLSSPSISHGAVAN
jgi:hypothetical protein